MKNICVVFGGKSVEHDVSVITGVMTVNSIDKEKYNAIPIYVDKDGCWYSGETLKDIEGYKNLNYKKLDRVTILCGKNKLYRIKFGIIKEIATISAVINCMHGERGEDGALAGLISMTDIAFISPSITPSAVFIDKIITKIALNGLKVNALPYAVVKGTDEINSAIKKFGYPVVVKPNRGGSSIGIGRATNEDELFLAVSYALRFGDTAIIEPCLDDFIEINCSAYLNKNNEVTVSECEQPVGRNKILSFADKYQTGKRIFPANIGDKLSNKIKSITKKIYKKFNFIGVIRIDYFVFDNEVYVNEVNTVPGSLSYYLYSDTLKGFTELISEWIEVGLIKNAQRENQVKNFDSGILYSTGGKGAKHL